MQLYINFKTSHVKVYLSAYTPMMCRHRHFKTSHVKVYHRGDSKNSKSEVISKHPMLKFIENRNSTALVQTNFKTSHVKVYPTHFLHFIQSTISDFSVFINILKIFTSRRTLCQKNSQNRCKVTVFADSRNFALIGGW